MPLARPSAHLPRATAALLAALLGGCDFLEAEEDAPRGGPPPPGFATEMLDTHNAVRASPASVGGSPAPSPPLAPLGWSDAAAATAQAWADGCTYAHNAARGSLGENIAATAPAGLRDAAYVVLEGWAAEAPFYDHAANTCDEGNPANEPGTCGHYTQIVWRDTTVVGCGFRTCSTGSPFGSGSWDFWVCNYAPPGNFIGVRPY